MIESDKNQQKLENVKKFRRLRRAQIGLVNLTDTLLLLVYTFFVIYVIKKNEMNMKGIILLAVITLIHIYVIIKIPNKKKLNILIYTIFIFFDVSISIIFLTVKEEFKDTGYGYLIFSILVILAVITFVFRILLYIVLNIEELKKGIGLFAIIFILALIVGLLDNLPIAGGVFLIGLVFVLMSEDMLKMIQFNSIDNSYITKKYEEQIKIYLFQQKIYGNAIFAIFYIFLLIIDKFNLEYIYKSVNSGIGIYLEENELELWLFRGLVYILFFIFVVFLVNAIFVLTKKAYNKNREDIEYGFMNHLYSIFNTPEPKIYLPKIIDEINIGKDIIDKINPEILITNREEIPKNIQVFLEGEPTSSSRKLLIIYPNKRIYECKYLVKKNKIILKKEIKLINKQDFKNERLSN